MSFYDNVTYTSSDSLLDEAVAVPDLLDQVAQNIRSSQAMILPRLSLCLEQDSNSDEQTQSIREVLTAHLCKASCLLLNNQFIISHNSCYRLEHLPVDIREDLIKQKNMVIVYATPQTFGRTLVQSKHQSCPGHQSPKAYRSVKMESQIEKIIEQYRQKKNALCSANGSSLYKIDENLVVKVVRVDVTLDKKCENLSFELDIMMRTRNQPNLMCCDYAFFDAETNCVVMSMEHMDLGSVSSFLTRIRPRKFPEIIVAAFAYALFKALEFLHETLFVVHCDIKWENVLLSRNGQVRLSDYGVSIPNKIIREQNYSSSALGTSYTLAPERQSDRPQEYSYPSDIWSVGPLLRELLNGTHPFKTIGLPDSPLSEIRPNCWARRAAVLQDLTDPRDIHNNPVSPSLCEIIHLCERKEPLERPTARQFLNHNFFDDLQTLYPTQVSKEKLISDWINSVLANESLQISLPQTPIRGCQTPRFMSPDTDDRRFTYRYDGTLTTPLSSTSTSCLSTTSCLSFSKESTPLNRNQKRKFSTCSDATESTSHLSPLYRKFEME